MGDLRRRKYYATEGGRKRMRKYFTAKPNNEDDQVEKVLIAVAMGIGLLLCGVGLTFILIGVVKWIV